MNREEVSKLIPILQAFVDGKELRRKYGAGFVNDHDEIHLDQEYIIKPEPRKFKVVIYENGSKEVLHDYGAFNKGVFEIISVTEDGE